MMTERLYFFSDALEATATALSCQPLEDGTYAVVLDRTLFHPQGGGQPSDTGILGGVRMLKAVNTTTNDGADSIHHITDGPVPPGPVSLRVDAAPRHLHTRLHSAGHCLAVAAEGFGWRAIKAHHWPGESRVVFEGPPQTPTPDADALTAAAMALIHAGHQRCLTQQANSRHVSFGLLPAAPCGGTHVADLSAIGSLVLTRISQKKGALSVSYDVSDAP